MNRFIKLRCLNNKASSILFKSMNNQQTRSISYAKPLLAGYAKDYKPGSFPKTEAERIAAAKKYGMKPEDYKPFPDDGLGFGDYPDLPPISVDMKSDYAEYDDFYLKRNYGEPLIITAEQVTVEKVTLSKGLVSNTQIVLGLFIGAALFFGISLYTFDVKASIPLMAKQYPRNALNGSEQHFKI